MFFDSHAHLDDPRFAQDLPEVIARAKAAGVSGILTASQDEPSSVRAAAIAAEHPGYIFAAVGIHPHEAKTFDARFPDWMKTLCAKDEVVAIGETGLDYHYDLSPRPDQQRAFEAHLEFAAQTGLPVILHCREAWPDCLAILRNRLSPAGAKPVRGVAHCFGGELKHAEELIGMGFFISFAGTITFPKAADLRDIAKVLPKDRILIETDCPYLAPTPHRGRRNEPSFVRRVAEELASARGVPVDEVARATFESARRLFTC